MVGWELVVVGEPSGIWRIEVEGKWGMKGGSSDRAVIGL
jgi:hypothetical protein